MSNELLYDQSQEYPISIRFMYILSIGLGIIFLFIGTFSIIFDSPLFRDPCFQVVAILIGIYIISLCIVRIITFQNLRINENGIFPYSRSFHDVKNNQERYISFNEIDKILNVNGYLSSGKIIIFLKDGNIVIISKDIGMNTNKFLQILREKVPINEEYLRNISINKNLDLSFFDKKARKIKIKSNDVLFAFYDLGNIENPLGIIHDNKGNIILWKNEKIINKVEGINTFGRKIDRSKKWHKYLSPIVIDCRKGVFYRTTHRIIFIKEPNYFDLIFRGYPYFQSRTYFNEWKNNGYKESFSIPIKNIKKINKSFMNRIALYIVTTKYNYDIVIYPANLIFPLIKDLFNSKIYQSN